jgi:hypothetical protein
VHVIVVVDTQEFFQEASPLVRNPIGSGLFDSKDFKSIGIGKTQEQHVMTFEILQELKPQELVVLVVWLHHRKSIGILYRD